MKKLASSSLIGSVLLAATSAMAQTQTVVNPCPPDAILCANASASITIGPPPVVIAPPVVINPPVVVSPPPVVVNPPPPVVVIQPPLGPRVIVVQRRPTVIVQPVPPQRIIVVQQQQPMQQPTQVYVRPIVRSTPKHIGITLDGSFSAFGNQYGDLSVMAGGGLGLRFRGYRLGMDLRVAGYTGSDYNGDHRIEVPFSLSGMFVFNPQHRLQFYGILGAGVSWANVEYGPDSQYLRAQLPSAFGPPSSAQYTYFGGEAGLGVELQINRHFSILADARGFVRTRIDSDASTNPEFIRPTSSTTAEVSNLSAGIHSRVGVAFYF